MRRYLLGRIGQMIITLLLFQILLFLVLYSMPGDVTNQLLTNPDIPPEVRERTRRALGLDDPPLVQFGRWMGNFWTGDLGVSFSEYPRPVLDIMAERIPRTLVLFLSATVVQFVVGFHMGRLLAWRRGGVFEYGSTIIGVLLYTVFTPWFALVMIFIFSVQLNWFPIGKFLDPVIWASANITGLADNASKSNFIFNRMLWTATTVLVLWLVLYIATRRLSAMRRNRVMTGGTILLLGGAIAAWAAADYGYLAANIIHHLVLPVAIVTLVGFGGTMLLMRTSMLDTLREDYIQTARAKGLPEKVVRDKHAARNALLPVFTGLIIGLPFLFSGGIVTETIFSWPGMGLTLLNATLQEDIPLIMGTFSFIGVLALLAHLVADITYAFLDPRIRYGK